MGVDPGIERVLTNSEETEALGAELARRICPGDVILLEGPLGAGKTTAVRGMVAALGGDPSEVCSPTYVLLETYEVASPSIRRVHHADLYRVAGRASAPFDEIGLDEALDDAEAVTAVEWPQGWPWEPRPGGRIIRLALHYRGEGRGAFVTISA